MATLVQAGDEIWRWCANRFEGSHTGFLVFWRSEPPRGGEVADSLQPSANAEAFIRIKKLPPRPGLAERFWSRAVFELLNLEGSQDYHRVYQEAYTGTVSLEEWIERNTRIEHGAVGRLKAFYAEVWKPWAQRVGVDLVPLRWSLHQPDRYEDWIAMFGKSPAAYPWTPYGKYYQKVFVPYLSKKGDVR